ncbi:MAG: L-rhamnose isomerase [Bacillota bacterium]|jgi:L-rhamnose isomerase/sugar isomerase|nr:L-rhamnose isomerase [Bacillota bacterium]
MLNLSSEARERVLKNVMKLEVETPSWGYSSGGTRFFVYDDPTAARTLEEKIDDAAVVHKYTGITPAVALHIPWDKTDDWPGLKQYAESKGIRIGAINPNLFQKNEYLHGSVTNYDPAVRAQAVDHLLECVQIMRDTGSPVLSLWLADGTNYPGQSDFRRRKKNLIDSLSKVYKELQGEERILVEYKMFEPAFYHTDIGDWGMATFIAQALGERAQTLVDLGHHALGTNIEQIVAWLLDMGMLGGFHFNSKKYADDDLTTGSVNPHELFLIFCELVKADRDPEIQSNVVYMIDQAHFDKPKVDGMIQSVQNIQIAYAKALAVDYDALEEAQMNGDIIAAEEILNTAYNADVRPLLAEAREQAGLDPSPLEAYLKSSDREIRVARSK